MTVEELIKELQKLPGNAVVVRYDHEWGYFWVKSPPKVESEVEIVYHFTDKPSEKVKNVVVI